ncbi:MAG: hypothetical protein AAFQ94_22775 [Bacteroidota bacterium]
MKNLKLLGKTITKSSQKEINGGKGNGLGLQRCYKHSHCPGGRCADGYCVYVSV